MYRRALGFAIVLVVRTFLVHAARADGKLAVAGLSPRLVGLCGIRIRRGRTGFAFHGAKKFLMCLGATHDETSLFGERCRQGKVQRVASDQRFARRLGPGALAGMARPFAV